MNSLLTLFTSRKTQRVILGMAMILTTLYFSLPTLTTPAAKQAAVLGAIFSIAGLLGVDIAGIAHEDAAAKSQPTTQTNVNSDVTNAAPAGAPVAATPVAASPTPQPKPHVLAMTLQQLQGYMRQAAAEALKQQAAQQPQAPSPEAIAQHPQQP